MTTLLIIKLTLIAILIAGLFIYRLYKKRNFMPQTFYSINDGNQNEIVFAPDYNKEWFEKLDQKYSWNNFDAYDNRFWEYMYNLFDTLPDLAKGKTKSDKDFFNKLTRGQKVFYSILVFSGDTDNGGVYQFFFNKPQFCFAALEAFKELKLDTLSNDYEKCLNEFIGAVDSYSKRKEIFNNPKFSWKTRAKSFQEGYSDIKSAEIIEEYFYTDEFKKNYYKTATDYIDKNLDQFIRK